MRSTPAGRDEVHLDVQPDRHLAYLIAKVSHQLQLVLDRALSAEGITLTQFSALAHVARAPGLCSAELARLLLTTPQAVGTLVRRLTLAGFVERSPASARGLPDPIRLTPAGLSKLQAAEKIALAAEERALAALSPRQLGQVTATLQTLLTSLDGDHAGDS